MSIVSNKGTSTRLHSPTAMPSASAFLWNPVMMIQMNCRGYATAQFMQPEPAKYARGPSIEAQGFMQPEQPYYAHHPGRFFYIKDEDAGDLFSAPYEPVRARLDKFEFIAEQDAIAWEIHKNDIKVELQLTLSKDQALELWTITITNNSGNDKNLSTTPYFPVGYMSWMNQSAYFDTTLNAAVCKSITPYQKVDDYFNNKHLKDITFLLADQTPNSWELRQSAFEGEGGLHAPSALENKSLSDSQADYETPAATLQYKYNIKSGQSKSLRFIFGPAESQAEIAEIKQQYFSDDGFEKAQHDYSSYINQGQGVIDIDTQDDQLNQFVNHWLPRQIYYHGDVNRLSTDPQTRNYLQDNMGMAFIKPATARSAFLKALSQQSKSGAMPDGILLNDTAELKYINQVPHMDHCVWLPVSISAYLDETADFTLLEEKVGFADSNKTSTVADHIDRAMHWLFDKRDHRGLNYIEQGDWCDPMNMVGYQGKGVSIWLSLATAYACKLWSNICAQTGRHQQHQEFIKFAEQLNESVNQHAWHNKWYGRGITDNGKLFGIDSDTEGKIFLNPQSWAILSGAADEQQKDSIVQAIETHLESPYGVEMLAPAFTKMREDIGRVTQKHPGCAENGSVYNHAATFYIYALYQCDEADKAFNLIRAMLLSLDDTDLRLRGQLPVFIPNYYRGASRQLPRTAGRSSQLFNTGSVHWLYRCLIEGLFGVKGCAGGLLIEPKLPSHWNKASITRHFRGAIFSINYQRADRNCIYLNGQQLHGNLIKQPNAKQHYQVLVEFA